MEFLQTKAVTTESVTIELLQQVARTRLCLDMAADLLVSRSSTAGNHLKQLYNSQSVSEAYTGNTKCKLLQLRLQPVTTKEYLK